MSLGFSLFDWVTQRVTTTETKSSGPPADRIHLRVDEEQRFTASVRGMLHWCQLNERLVVQHHADDARVFAGFERFSRMRRVLSRYRDLSGVVRSLAIFGCADAALPLNAIKVGISERHPLAREWFLVVNAPKYKALISARDLDGFGPSGPLAHRRFLGVALHDPELVELACDHLHAETLELRRRAAPAG